MLYKTFPIAPWIWCLIRKKSEFFLVNFSVQIQSHKVRRVFHQMAIAYIVGAYRLEKKNEQKMLVRFFFVSWKVLDSAAQTIENGLVYEIIAIKAHSNSMSRPLYLTFYKIGFKLLIDQRMGNLAKTHKCSKSQYKGPFHSLILSYMPKHFQRKKLG